MGYTTISIRRGYQNIIFDTHLQVDKRHFGIEMCGRSIVQLFEVLDYNSDC